jgi:HSP20 family protein
MFETTDSIVIQMELAGVRKEDINIEFTHNYIEVSGIKRHEGLSGEESFQRMERPFGVFKRTFNLPKDISRDSISASFNEGLLEIVILKKEKAGSFTLTSIDIE